MPCLIWLMLDQYSGRWGYQEHTKVPRLLYFLVFLKVRHGLVDGSRARGPHNRRSSHLHCWVCCNTPLPASPLWKIPRMGAAHTSGDQINPPRHRSQQFSRLWSRGQRASSRWIPQFPGQARRGRYLSGFRFLCVPATV
jgi:hypothetical protein